MQIATTLLSGMAPSNAVSSASTLATHSAVAPAGDGLPSTSSSAFATALRQSVPPPAPLEDASASPRRSASASGSSAAEAALSTPSPQASSAILGPSTLSGPAAGQPTASATPKEKPYSVASPEQGLPASQAPTSVTESSLTPPRQSLDATSNLPLSSAQETKFAPAGRTMGGATPSTDGVDDTVAPALVARLPSDSAPVVTATPSTATAAATKTAAGSTSAKTQQPGLTSPQSSNPTSALQTAGLITAPVASQAAPSTPEPIPQPVGEDTAAVSAPPVGPRLASLTPQTGESLQTTAAPKFTAKPVAGTGSGKPSTKGVTASSSQPASNAIDSPAEPAALPISLTAPVSVTPSGDPVAPAPQASGLVVSAISTRPSALKPLADTRERSLTNSAPDDADHDSTPSTVLSFSLSVESAAATPLPIPATPLMASHPLVAIPAVTPTAAAIPAHVSVSTSATVTSSVDAAPTHTGTSSLSAPQTLVATPNVLEVGLASGTHGWLKIRAELEPATGQVSAAVLASSNSAAESLHHQLPAISAYLAGEQVNLSSLVVDRTSTPNMAADAGPAGGGSTPPRYEKSGSNSTAPATSWTPAETTAPQSNLAPESYPSTAGGWLSVRA